MNNIKPSVPPTIPKKVLTPEEMLAALQKERVERLAAAVRQYLTDDEKKDKNSKFVAKLM